MIERFNGRIAEVLATTRFDSAEHLADTIERYVEVYNQHIPQKALGHIPPLQAMKNRSHNFAGLDGDSSSSVYNYTGPESLEGCFLLSTRYVLGTLKNSKCLRRVRKPRYVRVRNSMILNHYALKCIGCPLD